MRDIPGIVREALGRDVAKSGVRSVSGGDINDAYLVSLEDGQKIFLKINTPGNAAFFSAEQAGLEALRKTDAIGVPKAITAGVSRDCSFLIMEYLEAGPRRPDYWERFGRQLAAMHKAETGEWTPQGKYGFTQNNFIGAGRQNNHICGSWIDFFREYRLEQQFRWAEAYFDSYGRKAMQSLLDHGSFGRLSCGTGISVAAARRPVGRKLRHGAGRKRVADRSCRVRGARGGGPCDDGVIRGIRTGFLWCVQRNEPPFTGLCGPAGALQLISLAESPQFVR